MARQLTLEEFLKGMDSDIIKANVESRYAVSFTNNLSYKLYWDIKTNQPTQGKITYPLEIAADILESQCRWNDPINFLTDYNL